MLLEAWFQTHLKHRHLALFLLLQAEDWLLPLVHHHPYQLVEVYCRKMIVHLPAVLPEAQTGAVLLD